MSALLGIATIHLFALISPGPDFLFVTQSAIRQSRMHALYAALGVSLSILVWAVCALSGLHFIFQKIAWLQQVLMILGGCYLIYLGFQMLKAAFSQNTVSAKAVAAAQPKSKWALLLQGFFTNMANPKALIYFSSIFALAIDSSASLNSQSALLFMIWVESLLWFAAVAYLFSMPKMNQIYQRLSKWIDGITGGIFISFGCYLLLNKNS